jgi:polysaccharide biosynthesis transport protein
VHESPRISDESHPGVVGSLWRYRSMSAAIVLALVVLCTGVGFLVQPRRQAKATIALSSPPAKSVLAPGIQGDASLARYTAQRAAFVTSDAVLRSVATHLRRKDITEPRQDISATPSRTSNNIVIIAEANTKAGAVKLASAVVAAYRSETAKEVKRLTAAAIASIDASVAAVPGGSTPGSSSTLSQLEIEATQIRVGSALFDDGVDFVVAPRADAVSAPSFPLREAVLGLVLGLALAATAAWIRADTQGAVASTPRRPWTSHTAIEKSIGIYLSRPSESLPERTA